jgi:ATP-dependent RNA helicase DeaD
MLSHYSGKRKIQTQNLANELKQEGFRATTIHGDLSQGERENAMHKFKKGAVDILVATDIAARGIDVPAVGHIINYDIPSEPLMYFHRIGRTARAGARGKAISLVAHDRVDVFYRILRKTKHPIRRLNEEMGIGFITTKKSPIGRHRPRPDYRQNISHRNHGRYTDNRNMRSHREQRRYHRRYQR